MARKQKPPALVGGPYAAPACEPGSSLVCRLRGRQTVGGLTTAPIPWPYAARYCNGHVYSLIVCDDLVRAVKAEGAQAIAHHWGVGRHVVSKWRRALGVGRMTKGTAARWRELAPEKLDHAARSRGGKVSSAKRREAE